MDWRHRAICRDEDPELFFPIGNTGPALLQIEQAKAVCRRCPVVSQCLAWALESGQDAGVWGGMSEDERRILTLVIGSGPPEAQRDMYELTRELGLHRTYFLGPRGQDELATLFACADVGCFPSYREPFGLVFVECMACGTPVIGADSGGPRDFVTSEVGTLVPETDDRTALAASLGPVCRAARVDPATTLRYD